MTFPVSSPRSWSQPTREFGFRQYAFREAKDLHVFIYAIDFPLDAIEREK